MSPSMSLVYLCGFTGVATVTGLLLGAVVTEYRTVAYELQEARELLAIVGDAYWNRIGKSRK